MRPSEPEADPESGAAAGAPEPQHGADPESGSAPAPRRRPGRLVAALAGVGVAALGLGVAELVAGLSSRLRSPVLDVGDRVIDRVPSSVKDLAIDWFGTNDKVALLAGIGAVLVLYAASVGIVGLRGRLGWGLVGVGLFAVLGSAAALGDRAGADWFAPLPSVVGAAVAGVALAAMARPHVVAAAPRRRREPPGPDRAPAGPGRRQLLLGAGAFLAAGAALAAFGRRLEARFSAADSRAAITLPRAARPAPAVPAGARLDGAPTLFTPNDDFYRIDTALSVPQVRAEDWQLRVTGMVDRDLRLTYDDVLGRELVESDITLTCVSNLVGGELIGTARWFGVRLDDLLDDAGIDPAADQIVGRSVDGYTCGFPVAALDGRDALVAIGMNGEPLPLEHGFPARLIVPGIYGYASATKWLTEIELTTFDDFDHYWVPRGYAREAPIKLQSRIDRPRGLERIPPGPFDLGGVAWAQPVGVDAVEIRIDDGDWQPAELGAEVNASTWRQWRFRWDATPGRHRVAVRAVDRNGAIQTAERSEPLPDGATGHHTVVVLVDEA